MKTNDVLNLDYRKEENQEIINDVLLRIKPLAKHADKEKVPLEEVEKLIRVLSTKYTISVQQINLCFTSTGSFNYMAGLINNGDYVGYIYGLTIYELMAKIAIKMFTLLKRDELKERDSE